LDPSVEFIGRKLHETQGSTVAPNVEDNFD